MKKILVTGAMGYIGSKLCEKLLDRGYHVVGFDNHMWGQGMMTHPVARRMILFNEDVTRWSDNLIRQVKEADVIICLAALVGAPLCSSMPETSEELNYRWYLKLLDYTRRDTQVIFPSTNSGYGATGDGICTEETESNPVSLYAQQKQNAEGILLDNLRKNVVIFRLATVFGWSYRPRLDLLVNNLIHDAYFNKSLQVFNPQARRNYIHINDVTNAFCLALDNFTEFGGAIYNVGNDELNCTKMELANKIAGLIGATTEISIGDDPDKRDYIISSQKIMDKGFKAGYNIEYGVREMVHFFSNMNKNNDLELANY
jgi:nucleoside-diphosphate-sugar epimerase